MIITVLMIISGSLVLNFFRYDYHGVRIVRLSQFYNYCPTLACVCVYYMYVCVYQCLCLCVSICVSICVCLCLSVSVSVCINMCMSVSMSVCLCVQESVYLYVSVCTHLYAHVCDLRAQTHVWCVYIHSDIDYHITFPL